MEDLFSLSLKQLKERNQIKYLGQQPSLELINSVIQKSGLRYAFRFERVFGIAKRTISKHVYGERNISSRYWHLFYEFDEIKKLYEKKNRKRQLENFKKLRPVRKTKVVPIKKQNVINDCRKRLGL